MRRFGRRALHGFVPTVGCGMWGDVVSLGVLAALREWGVGCKLVALFLGLDGKWWHICIWGFGEGFGDG